VCTSRKRILDRLWKYRNYYSIKDKVAQDCALLHPLVNWSTWGALIRYRMISHTSEANWSSKKDQLNYFSTERTIRQDEIIDRCPSVLPVWALQTVDPASCGPCTHIHSVACTNSSCPSRLIAAILLNVSQFLASEDSTCFAIQRSAAHSCTGNHSDTNILDYTHITLWKTYWLLWFVLPFVYAWSVKMRLCGAHYSTGPLCVKLCYCPFQSLVDLENNYMDPPISSETLTRWSM
jgi:hypothetical protein